MGLRFEELTRQDHRMRDVETHQESFHELIFALSASLQPTQQTEHGNEVTQGLKHQNRFLLLL